mmetsp:Transcript_5572/g.7351  ORF Transcript_5572/g.7351 Transcript_5572/m.7351 type:complete len:157 (-) Transcript_5572:6-476(-)
MKNIGRNDSFFGQMHSCTQMSCVPKHTTKENENILKMDVDYMPSTFAKDSLKDLFSSNIITLCSRYFLYSFSPSVAKIDQRRTKHIALSVTACNEYFITETSELIYVGVFTFQMMCCCKSRAYIKMFMNHFHLIESSLTFVSFLLNFLSPQFLRLF